MGRLKMSRRSAAAVTEIDEDITREFEIRLVGGRLCRGDDQYLAEYRHHLAAWAPALVAWPPDSSTTEVAETDGLYDEVIENNDDYSDVYAECSAYSLEHYDVDENDDEVTMNALYYSSYLLPLDEGGFSPPVRAAAPGVAAPPPLPRRLSESRPPPRPPLPPSYYLSV